LYDEHAPYVLRALRYLGVPSAELDDALQETFIVASKRLGDLRETGHRAWLYAIAYNVGRHARRKSKPESNESHGDSIASSASGADQSRIEARNELIYLLSFLDEEDRMLVVYYHVEQMTMREVAEIIGVPVQTAYSRLASAMRALAEARQREGSR
jgi:RNA polymerase sigma-70 factor (ECF subfamily)